MNEFFAKDSFARQLGIELINAAPGSAEVSISITDQHLNSLGTGHGGVIFSLADIALEIACNGYEDSMAMGLQVNSSFITAVKPGDQLTATASETSLKNRIGNYTAEVRNQHGELVAHFQAMVYRKQLG